MLERKKIRLNKLSYSQLGDYFVTICVNNKKSILSTVDGQTTKLSELGKNIQKDWFLIENNYPGIKTISIVFMPNHIHAVIQIIDDYQINNIVDFIGSFKSKSTVTYLRGIKKNKWRNTVYSLWQRSFHDRILRNQNEFDAAIDYISNNPLKWPTDKYNT